MSVSTTDPMIGRLIDGRYRVRSRIARGGMATVYLATDLRLERRVAVKVMHGHLADDDQFTERFIREARSAARLAHPNVVNVFDQGQDGESAYLVMEYLPGITLRELLQEYGRLTTAQTAEILDAVLSGLAAAHKAGIVHRDLKPENVLLADDGRIKIGDFGLARAVSANTATGAALLGTIAYLSPELITRGVADTRSDIYAAGIMLYEMLTGEQPFTGEQPMQIAYQHAHDQVPTPSSKNPEVPAELDELVLWATDRDPQQRPRDAKVMLEHLQEAIGRLQDQGERLAAPMQRTIVMPAAGETTVLEQDDAETQILGARRANGTGQVGSDTAVLLTERTSKRRRRGWWLFALVLVLASAAGGAGWYFGAGPGARLEIPQSVQGQTVEQAREALESLGFTVREETGRMSSPTIEEGLVAGTSPEVGTVVAKDEPVTLLVSTGPEPLPVPEVIGIAESEAREALSDFTIEESIRQFSSDVAQGTVLDLLGTIDGEWQSLADTAQYGELQPVRLVVSAGALPDVSGRSFEQAAQVLADVGLDAERGAERFNDSIDKGLVVGIEGTDSPIRTGDTVTLTISKGPDLVQIPQDILDMTIAKAVAALEALEFKVDVDTNIPKQHWNNPLFAEVDDADPGPGEWAKRGSKVKIEADAFD